MVVYLILILFFYTFDPNSICSIHCNNVRLSRFNTIYIDYCWVLKFFFTRSLMRSVFLPLLLPPFLSFFFIFIFPIFLYKYSLNLFVILCYFYQHSLFPLFFVIEKYINYNYRLVHGVTRLN